MMTGWLPEVGYVRGRVGKRAGRASGASSVVGSQKSKATNYTIQIVISVVCQKFKTKDPFLTGMVHEVAYTRRDRDLGPTSAPTSASSRLDLGLPHLPLTRDRPALPHLPAPHNPPRAAHGSVARADLSFAPKRHPPPQTDSEALVPSEVATTDLTP